MSDHVLLDAADGVCTIRLARPEKKNALTGDMYAAMSEALEAGGADPSVRAFLFCGSPGAFSAGNDIGDLIACSRSEMVGAPIMRFLRALVLAEKPLVAAVDGLAVGIGVTMLMHCDHVIASRRSTFRTPFLDLGLVPEAGSTLLAPRLMGTAWAFELLVMGEPFSAERAREAGLVNHVAPPGEVETAAMAAARGIAAKPAEALGCARRLLRGDRSEVLRRLEEEAAAFAERLASSETQAALAAFMSRKG